jgi:hypothetical protein
MNTAERNPRRGGRTRVLLTLAITLSPIAYGDSRVPDVPGLEDVRGGDIELPRPTWERRSIHALIREAAAAYGVDPGLVRAMVWVESRYNPYAVSPRGARGLMQLTPVTAREVGVTNPFDARQNVFGGVKYLSRLIKQHDGDVALALASYNAGPATVRRFGGMPPYGETTEYLTRIRQQFGRLPDPVRPVVSEAAAPAPLPAHILD